MSVPLTLLVYSFTVFLAAMQALILYRMATNKINLRFLLSDEHGDASLSRFQFLIFTFVIGASFLYLPVKGGVFPTIDDGVLVLLGISGATYAVGKSLDKTARRAPTASRVDNDERSPAVEVTKTSQTTTATVG